MSWKIAGMFLVALALGAGGTQESDKKEFDKFAGTWSMTECIYDGTDHSMLKLKVKFKGNEGTIEGNEKVLDQYGKIKIKLDPSAKPKTIDIVISAGSQTDAKLPGIYEWKDDELRICATVFGLGRPKEFAAPDGSSTVLLVLKRDGK